MFRKTTLKNGLRIITVPLESSPSATVLALVGTGSKYEKKEISGVSHFLEHMFFKGTKKRPDTTAIAEALDKVGGIYNAFTGEECTGYFAKVDVGHLDLALDWVSDIFLNSKLESKEIEREKGVIIEEINMIFDHPISYVQDLWKELLYGDQPAGWNIAGTKETVSAISQDKLKDYFNNQYVASNTVICIAGNIDSKKAAEKTEKYFFQIKQAKFYPKGKVFEKQSEPECLLKQKETDQTHLCFGARAYNVFHPQKYAQEILGVILGGMMSSRLFIEVRERLGLAYYISSESIADLDTGFLLCRAGVDNKNIEKAILAILKEYKKISREKVPAQELKKAKDYIKGKMALQLESSDSQASFYGAQELIEKKILTPKEICKEIDKVSADQILKLAKEIFQPERLNLAIIGPFEDKKRFQKLLTV